MTTHRLSLSPLESAMLNRPRFSTPHHPGQYGPTGRCLTCDSRQCPPEGCLNPTPVDDQPEPDPLAFLGE